MVSTPTPGRDLVVRADRQLRQPLLARGAAGGGARAPSTAAPGGRRAASAVLDLLGARIHERVRAGSGPSRGTRRRRSARAPRRSPARATGRARSRAACPRASRYGATIVRPSAWRAYSASIAGSRVSRALSPIASSIGAEVADRDALAQQRLQHALDLAERQHVRDDLVDDRGVDLLELVEQLTRLLAGEQLGGVGADHLGEVGDDDRLGVDDGPAQRLGLGAAATPGSRPRAGRRPARWSGCPASWPMASPGFMARWWPAITPPRATSVPRTRMTYSCESRPTSSRMRTGGMTMPSSEAIWRRIVPTRAQQRAAAPAGRRAGPGRSRSPARAGRARARRARRRAARGSSPGRAPRRPRRLVGLPPARRGSGLLRSDQPTAKNSAADDEERDLGQRRGRARTRMITDAGDERRLALVEDLAGDRRCRGPSRSAERVTRMPVATEISSAGICAHRPSPTVSSEKCVAGLAERHALLDDADDDAAEQVDAGDQDAGHRVALDELRGTVHRAVEVGLLGDLGAALARLLVGDLAGVEVGVDRHLLAGHGVEGEARADLGHAAGAVRDDDELDHDQDQEDRRGRRRCCRRRRSCRTPRPRGRRRRAAGSAASRTR